MYQSRIYIKHADIRSCSSWLRSLDFPLLSIRCHLPSEESIRHVPSRHKFPSKSPCNLKKLSRQKSSLVSRKCRLPNTAPHCTSCRSIFPIEMVISRAQHPKTPPNLRTVPQMRLAAAARGPKGPGSGRCWAWGDGDIQKNLEMEMEN